MTDFTGADLSGSTFDDVDLRRARFRDTTLRDSVFSSVDLRGLRIRDAWFTDVDISADIENVRINGVDVVPLIDAELNRRYPERPLMQPADADGYRLAWDILERRWEQTVGRARRLDPALLHEQVDGEWSFIETLRHLVFATDAWIRRAMLGDPSPWHPLGLPHDEMPDIPGVPRDRAARPTLDEVLAVRSDRQATMRNLLAELTDDQLSGTTTAVADPGYPESESFPVTRCLLCILNEEWQHRLYAERDLEALAHRLHLRSWAHAPPALESRVRVPAAVGGPRRRQRGPFVAQRLATPSMRSVLDSSRWDPVEPTCLSPISVPFFST